MKLSNSTKTNLKITFIDKKEKSTVVGLLDSFRNAKGEYEKFFWNCTCISKAKAVVDSLEVGNFVNIKEAEVFIRAGKGAMFVQSLEEGEGYKKKEGAETTPDPDEQYGTNVGDYSEGVPEDEHF